MGERERERAIMKNRMACVTLSVLKKKVKNRKEELTMLNSVLKRPVTRNPSFVLIHAGLDLKFRQGFTFSIIIIFLFLRFVYDRCSLPGEVCLS